MTDAKPEAVSSHQEKNKNARTFHSRAELADNRGHFERGSCASVPALVELLFAVPGVTAVFTSPYSLDVRKAELYSWMKVRFGW